MKIAIIGYGRMGRLIEKEVIRRGHEISCIIDKDNTALYSSNEFKESDVAIQFSCPSVAVEGILACFAVGVPVVVGTTGWTDSLPEIKDLCMNGKGTALFSSNFSIGMNVFMALNTYMAKIMNGLEEYSPSLTEVHHVHKLDHPSGTAITLADKIVSEVKRLMRWSEPEEAETKGKYDLPVYHRREGEVTGIHTVAWDSSCDTITMTHEAKNRMGFVEGAVSAAEWIIGRKGFFTLGEMLSVITGIKGVFA